MVNDQRSRHAPRDESHGWLEVRFEISLQIWLARLDLREARGFQS